MIIPGDRSACGNWGRCWSWGVPRWVVGTLGALSQMPPAVRRGWRGLGQGRGQVTDTLSPDLCPLNPELGEGSPREQDAGWDLVRGLVASRLGCLLSTRRPWDSDLRLPILWFRVFLCPSSRGNPSSPALSPPSTPHLYPYLPLGGMGPHRGGQDWEGAVCLLPPSPPRGAQLDV